LHVEIVNSVVIYNFRMMSGILTLTRYWLPPAVDETKLKPKLARFYAERADYHAMTAREDKVSHPQVRFLLERIRPSDTVVEFGCGGGVVLSAAGNVARRAIGFDIGDIAVRNANARPGRHSAFVADVASVPLAENSADLVYSFEVLEHVWNPARVIEEMLRVVKPGGTVFFTTPNGYSMDMHLHLRPAVRFLHHVGAACAMISASTRRVPYENIPPNLEANPVYPDCDMISRLHPLALQRFARTRNCEVERLETFFFQQDKAPSELERRRFQHLDQSSFYRWHGDHIFFVGRKK
jgi:SAM-dependent methyltransferase